MPCICGEVTCICFYVCACQSQSCFCQACIVLRDPHQQQAILQSPIKRNLSPSKSRSRKKSAQRDPSNEQMSSIVKVSPPGQSQMSPAPVFDQRNQTLGSSPATKAPKQSLNDPYPTIRKHLSHPPSNYDPHPLLRKRLSDSTPPRNHDLHATLKRQLSQPTPPSNFDPHATLKRQLSQPCKIPFPGNLFSELPPSVFHRNTSSTGGSSSASSVSNDNPSLQSTSKTGSSKSPSKSGLKKSFKSGNSSNSSSKINPTIQSDSNSSCASIEYIKKASDKALPSYESFSSRFTTPASDENNNSDLVLTISPSQNQDTRQTPTDPSGRCSEIHTPLYLETSGASSASCNNPESQSLHSPHRVPLQLSPQDHPLNLSLTAEDKHKILFSHSLELSTRSPSPVPTKQQRMDTMEFSNIPTSESDNPRSVSYSGESSGTFSNRQELWSTNFPPEGSCPRTRSESTASTSRSSAYTSCIIQNPSQYTVTTEQYESPMETEAFSQNVDQNPTNCPLPAPLTSGFFPPPLTPDNSQASVSNVITYCNNMNDGRNFTLQMAPSDFHNLQEIQNSQSSSADLNRFPDTPENPFLEDEVFSTSDEQTSSIVRVPVIVYQPSQLRSQSTSTFPASQATNPVNIPYEAQSHHASTSTFPPSMNLSDVRLLASRTSNETQINPQASVYQPVSSDVTMTPAFSIAPSTESLESYTRSQEHFQHYSQSSTLQSVPSEIPPSQRTTRHRDDETGENSYTNRSKRKLS